MVTIIDADSHVTEGPDVWTARMSKKWGDMVPHIGRDDQDRECWFVGKKNVGLVASSSFVRLDPETGERRREKPTGEYFSGKGYAELHPASYDANARLKIMDEFNVAASVLYPNLNLVVSDLHEELDDQDYKVEIIRAYNDWLAEWASADPNRLIAMALVPYFDPKESAKEVYRAKDLGHRGLVMTGVPTIHGRPPLADKSWDPLWAAAEETGLSISFHVGANAAVMSKNINPERQAAEGTNGMNARAVTATLLDNTFSLNDLLMSGVLPRFPGLKFVIVETGVGWVNFCLESADYHFDRFEVRKEHPEFEMKPSDYFRRQVYATYWFEKMDPFYLERLTADRIMFETDFPHSTSLDPADVEWAVNEGLGGIDPVDRDKILWRNAAELYKVDVEAAAPAAV
jgi:predicted TIM-barrel fold metal-dependent hydrolase